MESEQGLSGKDNTMESECESSESSSGDEKVPEESSRDPIGEVLIQASVMEEERSTENNENVQSRSARRKSVKRRWLKEMKKIQKQNATCELEGLINNEEGINPEKASTGEKASLLVGIEPDARREKGFRQKLNQAPRYFEPPKCSGPACHKYGGNKVKKHKSKKKQKPCYICADVGHEGKSCKKVNDCFICSGKGHLAMDCPNKNVEVDLTSRLCLKCGNTGHDMFSCTNDYDSEDVKAIVCYSCKKAGHLSCVEDKTEGPSEASCYNCGESGHFGSECTKSRAVAIDPEAFCKKCKKQGHYRRQCPKKKKPMTVAEKEAAAAAKAAKKKARRARRMEKTNPTPTINASQSQPNRWWCPPIVGPFYGRPGSNVWLSPAAAARSNVSHHAGLSPFPQNINHQIGIQVPNPFTQFPHPYWHYPNRPQIPQTGSEILQPMIQLPDPTWEFHIGTQIVQPHLNHQTGIMLSRIESQVPQNSTVLPTQFHRVIQNNPQQPLSHQTGVPPHHHVLTINSSSSSPPKQ